MTRQRVLEPGDGESGDQHCEAEEHRPEPTAFRAASDQIAGYTDDGGAGIPSPGDLVDGWGQENRNTHNYRNCCGSSQLDHRSDAIGFGEFAIMDESTSNTERKHVRDS
jgi:hypothetical protein